MVGENTIQVFVVPPNGHRTFPMLLDPSTTTIDHLRHAAASTNTNDDGWDGEELPYWHPDGVRLTVEGKPVLSETATLSELNITDGSVFRTSGRLRGGAALKLNVKTKFGCICCCNHCTYDCCSNGRKYEVTVNSIDDVSTIFAAIAVQNPTWTEKKASGILIKKEDGMVLESDRKLLFYDLKNGDEIWLQLTPTYWFTSDFRKKPKTVEDEEEDEEFQRAVKEAKEAKKKAAEEKQQAQSHHEDVDSKEGVEDIELGSH